MKRNLRHMSPAVLFTLKWYVELTFMWVNVAFKSASVLFRQFNFVNCGPHQESEGIERLQKLTQLEYTDTGPNCLSIDLYMQYAMRDSYLITIFKS